MQESRNRDQEEPAFTALTPNEWRLPARGYGQKTEVQRFTRVRVHPIRINTTRRVVLNPYGLDSMLTESSANV